MGVLCTWVKLLTDLQILGCELHKNAFGGRPDPLGSYWGSYIALPDPLAVIKRRRGREGREGVGRDGKGGKGARFGYLSSGPRVNS